MRSTFGGASSRLTPLPYLSSQDMSLSEQFGRAFITLRSTFGGAAAIDLWDQLAAGILVRKSKANSKALQAAFVGAWGEAAKNAQSKKGKVCLRVFCLCVCLCLLKFTLSG